MLAHDVGGSGVKVRPNGLVKGKDHHGRLNKSHGSTRVR